MNHRRGSARAARRGSFSGLRALVLHLLLAAAATAQKPGEVDKVVPDPSAPRGKVLEATSSGGQPYWYRLPKKLSERDPPNLIFMLHGTGMPWGWAFWNYPIESGQLRGDDIVVAPEGMTPGQGDTFNFLQAPKDGDQIAELIRLFRKHFPIDKVYVYGHSQGAFFAYWFAGEYTELVDGIIAHAGNVLSVNHNKLAKEKVAIGILHGKADAVVPVDCAYRTERIYREEGYKKLKLYVVEGLNETSGHWPLPQQVSEMFEWLDQVSADTLPQTLRVAWTELGKDAPDLQVLSSALERAETLLKKARGEEKETHESPTALLRDVVAELETAHRESLAQAVEAHGKSEEFAVWMPHFRIAHAAFGGSPTWQKELKPTVALAEKHTKAVAQAVKKLNQRADKRTVESGVEALEEGPLASDYDLLAQLLSSFVTSPPKGIRSEVIERYQALVEQRSGGIAEARDLATQLTASIARRFTEEHGSLLEDT